jgi:RNA ligase
MQFPVIEHIDQVREAIKDRPEFIEADRGTYTVFDYTLAHTDSFDCPLRRECRGLIFDDKGRVLSRRFHKFFNLGEKEETFPQNINWNQSHVLLEKLDGSMITPLIINDDVRWATKMGLTDIGLLVDKFVASRPHYVRFAQSCHFSGWTPIFEYVAPHNRIVLPYQEENLVLLAMRHNVKGEYLIPSAMRVEATEYRIPVVPVYNGSMDDLKNKTDIEGIVVRFDSGHMVKVKTDWYVAIHRAKENLLFEKDILKMILEEKLDDVLPHLKDDDRKRIEKYQREIGETVDAHAFAVNEILTRCANQSITRKDFALKYMQKAGKFVSQIVFSCWDKSDYDFIRQQVINAFLRHTTSQTAVDSIRDHLNTKWEPMGAVE